MPMMTFTGPWLKLSVELIEGFNAIQSAALGAHYLV